MARTPESAAVDFAESSLFTGRFSILSLAACGVGFGLSGRLPAAIFSQMCIRDSSTTGRTMCHLPAPMARAPSR